MDVGFAGAEFEGIDASLAGGAAELVHAFLGETGEGLADGVAGGVDFHDLAGFGVFKGDEAKVGELLFVAVAEVEEDEVVAFVGEAELAAEALEGVGGLDEVGEDEDDGAAALDVVAEVEGGGDVGAAARGGVGEDFADDAEDVVAAFGGGEVLFDLVGEEEEADFVAVADGGEGEDAGDFGGEFLFALGEGAEVARGADIDGEEDGEFAFFAEFFDEGDAGAGGDVPVDEADFVAGGVFADFIEVHAAALEDGVVFAGEGVGDEAAGAQLDLTDFLEDFAGGGGVHG